MRKNLFSLNESPDVDPLQIYQVSLCDDGGDDSDETKIPVIECYSVLGQRYALTPQKNGLWLNALQNIGSILCGTMYYGDQPLRPVQTAPIYACTDEAGKTLYTAVVLYGAVNADHAKNNNTINERTSEIEMHGLGLGVEMRSLLQDTGDEAPQPQMRALRPRRRSKPKRGYDAD